jgi:hypothetical protein
MSKMVSGYKSRSSKLNKMNEIQKKVEQKTVFLYVVFYRPRACSANPKPFLGH